MNKICTDIEQTKKLIELGIDVNTADMFWELLYDDKRRCIPLSPLYESYDDVLYVRQWTEPAWSLSALLELIPDELQDNHFLTLEKEKDEYCCCFEDINGNSFNHFFGNNAIDVAFEMMCWLLDSRKL